jgi:hypothetical protein
MRLKYEYKRVGVVEVVRRIRVQYFSSFIEKVNMMGKFAPGCKFDRTEGVMLNVCKVGSCNYCYNSRDYFTFLSGCLFILGNSQVCSSKVIVVLCHAMAFCKFL